MTLEKSTNQQTRRSNERLVLRTVHDRGPISRADVARATGLTRTTVSDLVESLVGVGLVRAIGTGPSTGGKAPILLEVPADARSLIGIEVDRNRISGAVVNLRGQISHREAIDLNEHDGQEAVADLEALVLRLVDATDRPLVGVGIGAPGLIDSATGTVRWAVGLDWRDVELGFLVAELTDLPTIVVNDSQAAAMAEWMFGRHDTSSAMVVLKVGEGIGAGIILGGRIYRGDDGGAGEVGHSRVADEGLACRCGSSGCLETVSSVRAVVERARLLAPAHPESMLASGAIEHASMVAAFRAGDALSRRIVLESTVPLGRVLGVVIGTLGARDVVLRGPMTDYGPVWLASVRAEVQRSALPMLAERSTIHLGRTGDDAVEIGAAAMLMASELGLALAA